MAKPRLRKEWDEELESILRLWPYIPEHVRKTFVDIVSNYGPPTAAKHFPTPAGASWTDVEIVLISPSEAEIQVGTVRGRYTFATAGLADKRDGKRPLREWRMLRTYAENPEPDAYFKLPKRGNLKKDISQPACRTSEPRATSPVSDRPATPRFPAQAATLASGN